MIGYAFLGELPYAIPVEVSAPPPIGPGVPAARRIKPRFPVTVLFNGA
jgi:hypothetical protein